MVMCDHNLEKPSEYLPAMSPSGHEVYRCECGALYDLRHRDNHDGDVRAMTAREIDAIVTCLLASQRSRIVGRVIDGVRLATRGMEDDVNYIDECRADAASY